MYTNLASPTIEQSSIIKEISHNNQSIRIIITMNTKALEYMTRFDGVKYGWTAGSGIGDVLAPHARARRREGKKNAKKKTAVAVYQQQQPTPIAHSPPPPPSSSSGAVVAVEVVTEENTVQVVETATNNKDDPSVVPLTITPVIMLPEVGLNSYHRGTAGCEKRHPQTYDLLYDTAPQVCTYVHTYIHICIASCSSISYMIHFVF